MKYIEKDYMSPCVLSHQAKLAACKLDETSLSVPDESYPGYTGSTLYDLVRNMTTYPALKKQLYKDQGGICCYCGMRLEYPFDPQYRVEHVKPKETYRELVGEYKNLLLSCRATKEEFEKRKEIPRRIRKEFMHCDEAKGSAELTYSPLNIECEKVFVYQLNGEIEGTNDYAQKDISTLGLNCDYLKRRRQEALQSLFDGNELLPEDLLREYKKKVLTRDTNNLLAEFCFVISNAIEKVLS